MRSVIAQVAKSYSSVANGSPVYVLVCVCACVCVCVCVLVCECVCVCSLTLSLALARSLSRPLSLSRTHSSHFQTDSLYPTHVRTRNKGRGDMCSEEV